jgi:hypothetical protein
MKPVLLRDAKAVMKASAARLIAVRADEGGSQNKKFDISFLIYEPVNKS